MTLSRGAAESFETGRDGLVDSDAEIGAQIKTLDAPGPRRQ